MSRDIEFKVEDHPHLVRRRGAIVNKDREGFKRFQAARQAITQRDERVNALEARLADLESIIQKLAAPKTRKSKERVEDEPQ